MASDSQIKIVRREGILVDVETLPAFFMDRTGKLHPVVRLARGSGVESENPRPQTLPSSDIDSNETPYSGYDYDFSPSPTPLSETDSNEEDDTWPPPRARTKAPAALTSLAKSVTVPLPDVCNFLPVPRPASHLTPLPPGRGIPVETMGMSPIKHPQSGRRTQTSETELAVLEQAFAQNRWPEVEERDLIGASLGWTARSVQIWFQNRRRFLKKQWLATHDPNDPLPPEMMPPPPHQRARARLNDTEARKTVVSGHPDMRPRTRKQYASEGGVPELPSSVQELIGSVNVGTPDQIIDAYGLLRQKREIELSHRLALGRVEGAKLDGPQPPAPAPRIAGGPPAPSAASQAVDVGPEAGSTRGVPSKGGKRTLEESADEPDPKRRRPNVAPTQNTIEPARVSIPPAVLARMRVQHEVHALGLARGLGSAPDHCHKHLNTAGFRLFDGPLGIEGTRVSAVAVRPRLLGENGFKLAIDAAAVGGDIVWFLDSVRGPVWNWVDPQGKALTAVAWGLLPAQATEQLVGLPICATAGASGVITILCPEEERLVNTLVGQQGAIQQLAFSPSKPSWLLSGGEEPLISLWDVSGTCVANFPTSGPTLALAWSNNGMYFNTSSGGVHPLFRKYYITDVMRKENEVPAQPNLVKRASRSHSSVEATGGAVLAFGVALGGMTLTVTDTPNKHNVLCSMLDRANEAHDRPGVRDKRRTNHPNHNPVCALGVVYQHIIAAPHPVPTAGEVVTRCTAIAVTYDGCIAVAGYEDGRIVLYNVRKFMSGGGLLCNALSEVKGPRMSAAERLKYDVLPEWELDYGGCDGSAITSLSISDSGALVVAGTEGNRVLLFHAPVEPQTHDVWGSAIGAESAEGAARATGESDASAMVV